MGTVHNILQEKQDGQGGAESPEKVSEQGQAEKLTLDDLRREFERALKESEGPWLD